MASSPPPPEQSFSLLAVLPFLAPVLTAVLGFFAAQFTSVAALQKTLLDASRAYVKESQLQHARDAARIFELEAEVLRQRGVINQGIQLQQSLIRLLEHNGIPIPGQEDK